MVLLCDVSQTEPALSCHPSFVEELLGDSTPRTSDPPQPAEQACGEGLCTETPAVVSEFDAAGPPFMAPGRAESTPRSPGSSPDGGLAKTQDQKKQTLSKTLFSKLDAKLHALKSLFKSNKKKPCREEKEELEQQALSLPQTDRSSRKTDSPEASIDYAELYRQPVLRYF